MIEGTLADAMAGTVTQCRSRPTDASARMQLFRLLTVTGQWTRAEAALDVAGRLDASLGLTVVAHRAALGCERFREEVFAGRRAPLFAGEPDEGLAMLAGALTQPPDAALRLRAEALEALDATAGTLDGRRFEWLADGDARLGPTLEVYLDGKYFWVPVARIERLAITQPTDVLDLVWCPAELTLRGSVAQSVLIPVRYPGSEASDDDAVRLARRTDWTELGDGQYRGLGQRMWATDTDDVALLDCRLLVTD
jgi:type VI secretion system protein ImpE